MKRLCAALATVVPMLTAAPTSADDTLWAALKDGGKVVLMRHAAIERTGVSGLRHVPGDCSQEMNLSRRGRIQAQQIGETLRAHGVPVGDVLASPYCRALDTARLAFGKAEASEALRLIEALPSDQADQVTARAMKLIGEYKGKENLVLVTHEPNVVALAFETIETAGMLVLAPQGADRFDVLGRIPAPKVE